METDVTKIYLTRKEIRYLKQINKRPIVLKDIGKLPKKYETLLDKGLIGDPKFVVQWGETAAIGAKTCFRYSITELGFEYLLYRKEKFADIRVPFIINTVLTVIAIGISVIALILAKAQ